jgi:hypothetical protein
MSIASMPSLAPASTAAPGLLGRLWRETARPFQPRTWRKWGLTKPTQKKSLLDLRGDAGSVEPEGLAFLRKLVKLSQQYPGPIVEIGTLFARTTTYMAVFKAPEQKLITVDTYGWNPWGLSREAHFELTSRVLSYLVQTGHVEQIKQNKNLFYATYRGPTPSLVFLDAVHTYEETKKDIEWAKSIGVPLIAGHDYAPHFPGVQQIVNEHGGPKELGSTVWLLP